MNAPEHRERNRRLGIVLGLLFVGLFVVVTATIITGSKTPPLIAEIMSGILSPILGIIGLLLIIVAVAEVVFQIIKKGESLVSDLVAPLLGVIGLLLIIGAAVGIVFEIMRRGESPVSNLVAPIFWGIIGLLLIIGAVVGNRYLNRPKDLK